MADEIVSINNYKEQILEFALTVEGVDTKDMTTRLVIHANDMELGFQATRKEGDTWTVKLPALPILERTAYPYHLEVVVEGNHFEPMKGTINVVGSHEVYVSAPKNPTISAPTTGKVEIKKESKAPPVVYKSEPTKQREKSVEQVARELMESNATKKNTATVKAPTKPTVVPVKEALLPTIPKSEPKKTPEKDQAVRDILEGAGFKSKAKPKARFTLKD